MKAWELNELPNQTLVLEFVEDELRFVMIKLNLDEFLFASINDWDIHGRSYSANVMVGPQPQNPQEIYNPVLHEKHIPILEKIIAAHKANRRIIDIDLYQTPAAIKRVLRVKLI